MKKVLMLVMLLCLCGCETMYSAFLDQKNVVGSYAWSQEHPYPASGSGMTYEDLIRPYTPAYSGYQGSNYYGSYGYMGVIGPTGCGRRCR
jgi:hypothetical protein